MDGTGQQRLALIELHERDGRVGRAVDVRAWPLSLGRALDNDIVLDDPHVAPHHARVRLDDEGRLVLEPLPSLNGVLVDGRRAAAATPLPAGGASLLLGQTRLRLRLPGETLAPELVMPGGVARSRRGLLGIALALAAVMLAGHWIALDPGAHYSAWMQVLVGVPAAVVAWCGLWALMSKLFQHRFDFGGHLRTVLPWLLALTLVESLWPQLAASLGAPSLWALTAPLHALLAALLLRAHLSLVLPTHQRAVNLSVAALLVAGGALSLASTWRSTDSLSAAPYMSTLPMPALRLAGTVPSATLVQDMAPLAAKLAQRVKKSREDSEEEGDFGE